jgi:glycosyltransferase involved in cell wall biosynthesis
VTSLRVLLVAEHASANFGGEAILPLHWFRFLRRRGVDVRLCVHERTRDELLAALPSEHERLHFVRDSWLHRGLWRLGSWLPAKLGEATFGVLLRLLTQARARRLAKDLIRRGLVDIVHQPIPVSPKDPSLLWGLGVPVVIGPLNGGMSYPPAFRRLEPSWLRLAVALLRRLSGFVHVVLRGKREAAVLLVANARTAQALPRGCRGRVVTLVENGVDFGLFATGASAPAPVDEGGPLRLLFVGRLIGLKALDIVLDAMAALGDEVPCTLDVAGDGPMRQVWQQHAHARGLSSRVAFHGFVPQASLPALLARAQVLVMPSLHECGGAVVLEAMAMERPVVATAWGGPLDYLDAECGILVPPDDRERLVAGFAAALRGLAADPEGRRRMGLAAARRCREQFDWGRKADAMLAVYRECLPRSRALD